MSISNCPHCYRKVIPSADGTCPACNKNTNDSASTDPHKVLVGICAGNRLPPVCHRCGAPTRHAKTLAVASEPQDTTFAPGLASLLISFLKPLAILSAMER